MVLGAITADEAAAQAMPKNTIRNTPGFTQAVYNEIMNAAQTGVFNDYNAQAKSCLSQPSNSGAKDLSLVGSGASLGLSTAITGGLIAAGPATAGISIAIAGIVGLFSTIFSHHAAAVAKENQILCASGPAANNYLNIIRQAVSSGQATPQQGISALQSLLSDYRSIITPIIKDSSSKCNAACVEYKELEAIVAYQSSIYQDMANAPPPPAPAQVTSSGPTSAPAVNSGSTMVLPSAAAQTPAAVAARSAAAASSTPSWLPIAALVIGGILLARVI
jgi:hypothetical protein